MLTNHKGRPQMLKHVERLWVSWLNSHLWRSITARGPMAAFFRSNAFHRMDRARRHAATTYRSWRHPHLFRNVQTFCTFVGHVKSGSTLVGSLLDAHPDAIIADEVNVPAYVAAGFDKEQIFHILLKASRRDHMKGRVTARRLTPYAVAVPGQWQGRYRTLRVIGHSQAGPVTGQLLRNPQLFSQIQATMAGLNLKIIHVIRNPFDPISLMMVRGNRTFENACAHYFSYCEALDRLHRQTDDTNLFTVHYETFIREPRVHLQALCNFLGLEATPDYLQACTAILYDEPEMSRAAIVWQPEWIAHVEQKMSAFAFLQGYSYQHPVMSSDAIRPSPMEEGVW